MTSYFPCYIHTFCGCVVLAVCFQAQQYFLQIIFSSFFLFLPPLIIFNLFCGIIFVAAAVRMIACVCVYTKNPSEFIFLGEIIWMSRVKTLVLLWWMHGTGRAGEKRKINKDLAFLFCNIPTIYEIGCLILLLSFALHLVSLYICYAYLRWLLADGFDIVVRVLFCENQELLLHKFNKKS